MPTNLKRFDDALVASAEKIHGKFEDFYQGVILELFRRIDRRTPVDTGLAQWNWQITMGSPATGVLLFGDNADGKDISSEVISREAAKLDGIPLFSLVYITNNVEYISYLEYDRRSKQHPEGFLEVTLTEMADWLEGIGVSNEL